MDSNPLYQNLQDMLGRPPAVHTFDSVKTFIDHAGPTWIRIRCELGLPAPAMAKQNKAVVLAYLESLS